MARGSTKQEFQAEPPSAASSIVGAGAACAKCGGRIALPSPAKIRLCGKCVLTWAFDPSDLPVSTTEPALSWDAKAPTLGPYVLIEEIGRGGMGVIYRAVHRDGCEEVALKTVLPQYASNLEILTRFQREAKTAQSFEHPHTMTILEVGSSEADVPFFTMPLALGGSLQHLGAKYRGRWRRIAELIVKVALAVHHAHQRGFLHRDIKPGNILFTEDHEPLVTDFGLAKQIANPADLTCSYAVLGTPNYVAPEQTTGRTNDLTPAVDVYGLGAVLFELLTGRPPFVGDNPLNVLQQAITKNPVRPRKLAPGIPQELEQICLRCLERLPTNRYASASALAHELECWLDGRAVRPRPMHLRLRGLLDRRSLIMVWIIVLVLSVVLLCALKIAVHPAFSRPRTKVIVMIEDLAPSGASRRFADTLSDGLKQTLSESRDFVFPERSNSYSLVATAPLDTLALGRASSAQVVFAGYLRQAGEQMHLVVQFIRCDTGQTIWTRRSELPLNSTSASLVSATKELVDSLRQSWNDCLAGKVHEPSLPVAEAKIFYTHAMELAAHGSRSDMEAAIELLQRAWKTDPHYAQACAMLAFSQWTMGANFGETDQYALAEKTARIALSLDPNSAAAHRVIASCFLQQARYNEAREEFETAVELNPESAGCCQSLGGCLRRMGQPAQAIPWLRRAALLEPAHGSFSGALGEALILCDLDQEAEEAFTHAVEIEMERPDAQFSMVALRVWQKRYKEAHDLCAAAYRKYPEYQYRLNFAAWVEFCGGWLTEAQVHYEALRAQHLYQNQWDFYGGINPASALAYIASQSGSLERSQVLANEALQIDRALLEKYPRNSRVLHDMAATYAVVGDESKAMSYLQQAVAAGWVEHRSTKIDPRFNSISTQASFQALLEGTKPKYDAVESLYR